MNYQQRIKNHDDPLSVAIDADRKITELKANNARLRDVGKVLINAMDEIYRLATCDNYVTAESVYMAFDDALSEAKSLIEGE